MRRLHVALVVAVLAFGACGGHSEPKPVPGSALDKAKEYVRRADALGLRHGSATEVARDYGMTGDGFCLLESRDEWKGGLPEPALLRRRAIRYSTLVFSVYCPKLLPFVAPPS